MRNTIKTIAALLIVLGAAKTNASVDSTSVGSYCKVVAQNQEDNFKLIYKGTQDETVSVEWIDETGQVVYSENIKSTDAFVKQYNLSSLPDGEYTVKVSAEDYEFADEVILGDMSGLKFNIRTLESKSVVMTGVKPDAKDVRLYVLDAEGNQIYSESYEEGTVVQKKYNFEGLSTDQVTFVLLHRGKVFQEEKITF
ncbi:MAG: hypothetical protein ABJG41_01230 [Cyclobacteriaceae bacterium]